MVRAVERFVVGGPVHQFAAAADSDLRLYDLALDRPTRDSRVGPAMDEVETCRAAAYGMIMMQGHGKMGVCNIETPTMIRFGQLTHDEFFVSEPAAKAGVKITNPSQSDPIVMLKHFGPDNPDLTLEAS